MPIVDSGLFTLVAFGAVVTLVYYASVRERGVAAS